VNKERDAAVLLIGNELLSGRVVDENLAHIARELWSLGIPVREVLIVRDEIEPIAEAVRWLSGRREWLFTAGGVGPTHDDVTVEGVAQAFHVGVTRHPELARAIRDRWGSDVSESHLRMARVPEGSTLEAGGGGAWPTVRKGNVFLLPGVPSILRRKLERLKPALAHAAPFRRERLAYLTEEATIAGPLARVAEAHPELEIGSYPDRRIVVVTLEGRDPQALQAARQKLESLLEDLPRAEDEDSGD
jgi:molybdenum cofactor synthesis domain-containing protein